MSQISVTVIDKVCQSQAASLAAARGQMSLIERGVVRYPHPWDSSAVVAMAGNDCVGILLFGIDETDNTASVNLAWCRKDAPSALAAMLISLRKHCRENTVEEVFFTCHGANDDMAKAASALRAEPWKQTYRVRF